MRSYEAARGYYSTLEFLAWGVIALGAIVAFGGLVTASQVGRGFGSSASTFAIVSAFLPGVGLAFVGFLGLVICQNGRAAVDSAEYSQQLLKVARDTLEVSKQALRQSGVAADPSFSAAPQTERPEPPLTSSATFAPASASDANGAKSDAEPAAPISYNGATIGVENGTYKYAGLMFHDLDKAKAYVDQLGVNQSASLQTVPQIAPATEAIEYRGVEVIKKDNKFLVGERMFYSEHAAQKYVDRTLG